MRTFAALAILTIAAGARAPTAQASYPGVHWGTTIEELQHRYPGGKIERDGPMPSVLGIGESDRPWTIYTAAVQQPTALFRSETSLRAETLFYCSVSRGLLSAEVRFRVPGTGASGSTREQAQIREEISTRLSKLHGTPRGSNPEIWIDSDGQIELGQLDPSIGDGVWLEFLADGPVTKAMRVGYANTKWGESLKAVRAAYPGGRSHQEQNGHVTYLVIREVAGWSNGLIDFDFEADRGLASVTIMFPRAGTTVDLLTGSYVLSDEDSKYLATIKNLLTGRYGPPEFDGPDRTSWGLGEVFLTHNRGDGAVIQYSPPGGPKAAGL